MRNPTPEQVAAIDGETQKLGFGDCAEYTYVEILTYKPKYVEFLIEDGDDGRLGRQKFTEWAKCKNVGIAVGEEAGAVE